MKLLGVFGKNSEVWDMEPGRAMRIYDGTWVVWMSDGQSKIEWQRTGLATLEDADIAIAGELLRRAAENMKAGGGG